MAGATYHTLRGTAGARVRLLANGLAEVESAASDMGPGTYTSMAQVASDALGVQLERVRFALGDSTFPVAPSHGGSQTMAGVGSAVPAARRAARTKALALAIADERSPFHGAPADAVNAAEARLFIRDDPPCGDSYQEILVRNRLPAGEGVETRVPETSSISTRCMPSAPCSPRSLWIPTSGWFACGDWGVPTAPVASSIPR